MERPCWSRWGCSLRGGGWGTVRARRFVLRGDGGQPIAQLVQGPNGGELELRDADGEITAVLGSGLKLCDRAGRVRADLRLEGDKAPLLELYDERGAVRASLSLGEDGAGSLAFYDETGQPRAGLGSGHAGAMRLSFFRCPRTIATAKRH